MTELYLVKRHGSLHPATEADAEIIAGMTAGDMYRMKYSKPRNYKLLQKYMVLVTDVLFALFKPEPVEHRGMLIEKNVHKFRSDMAIVCGYYELALDIEGRPKKIAKSISFGSMEEDEFIRLYNDTINYALQHFAKGYSEEEIDNWVNNIMSFT
jgi:hypothetical protein